jgi:4a-hydroxytetrahydrobiopterin dehydratase
MSTDEIAEALEGFTGWAYDGDAWNKTFTFDDFAGAIDFMAAARPSIDELNHHPEWTNVYNRVDVRLSSHDVGGVTDRDLGLARLLDGLAAS